MKLLQIPGGTLQKVNRFIKNTITVSISLLLCLLAYFLCRKIVENNFFDKFIYQKSISYGYRVSLIEKEKYQKFRPLINLLFGQRIKDMTNLESGKNIFTDKQFNIAIIGDSYVWGLGIKSKQRFAKILEKKLNQLRPTKVITLGQPGDGFLDYLYWYDLINTQKINPDLFIFTLVENDVFVDPRSPHSTLPKYKEIINICQQNDSTTNIINLNNIDIYKLNKDGYSRDQIDIVINDLHLKSLKNPINICIFQKVLTSLSNSQSIFFTTDNYLGNSEGFNLLNRYLISFNKNILSSELGKNFSKYSSYWDNGNPTNYFKISSIEGHPNTLANQMYADILFQEITTNSKWNFTKP